jgi:tetratricopeptide (TPR) repeat protein
VSDTKKGKRKKSAKEPLLGSAPAPSSQGTTTSAPEKEPTPWITPEWWWKLLERWLGYRRALVVFGVLAVAAAIAMEWPTVKAWPVVKPLLNQLTRGAVPRAKAGVFSVLVAHLENDPNEKNEKFVIDTLARLRGVEILRLDRTISTAGPKPQEAIHAGHETARQFLHQSGAAVLVWGSVLDDRLLRLYLTPSRELGVDIPTGRYKREDLELPALFGEQLASVLQLLVTTTSADFTQREGQFVADQLRPFVDKVRNLLGDPAAQHGWSPDTGAKLRFILANSLSTLGTQAGESAPLTEAIAAYRDALKERTREGVPLERAMIQNNLGNALSTLGERESGTEHLQEAVAAYRDALKEYTRERVPLDWAMTQNNLGIALSTLGERESGTEHLEQAIAAYRSALEESTPENSRYSYLKVRGNLARAEQQLAERKK